jgi:hypothetical protein
MTVKRGALAATVELRGKFLGVSVVIGNEFVAPLASLDVEAWRNAVYQKVCNVPVPALQKTFQPSFGR